MSSTTPFTVQIPQPSLGRLHALLSTSRLPPAPLAPGAGWEHGMPLSELARLKDLWSSFNFREVEQKLNSWPNYKVDVEGVELHFIHRKSQTEDAIPIVLTHGWPGSVWEFHKVIDALAEPGEGEPAFHVVVPSMPGYGFSGPPTKQGWGCADTARVFNSLMVDVLGYKSYVAQGGDWGSSVTLILSALYPSTCKAIHVQQTFDVKDYGVQLNEEEKAAKERVRFFGKTGRGYSLEHSTKPATIGYALYDNPIGLLSWIGEKFHEWSLARLGGAGPSDYDLLATVSIYYLTGTFPTSITLYYAHQARFTEAGQQAIKPKTPAGISVFPGDIGYSAEGEVRAGWGEKLGFYRAHERGGHFAGLDAAELLTEDVRAFFGSQWPKVAAGV